MSADETTGTRWSGLVDGLLDARTDPATARFDRELAAAVETGELSRRTAQRLRFWQRAALNGVDDHARTVLPAVLCALDTARAQAQAYVEQAAGTLDADHFPGRPPDRRPPDDTAPVPAPAPQPTAAELARQTASAPVDLPDDRRASTSPAPGPSTLEGPRPRLFVADLRDLRAPTDHS